MSKKILVIDDEELITKSLKKLLTREGYEVVVTEHPGSALEIIKEDHFDLIITDVRMPEMDGIETIVQIRKYLQDYNKPPIPEVLITGFADLDKYEKAQELNVARYVNKPFDNEEFLQITKEILR